MTEQLRAFAASSRGLEHPFQHPAVHNYITPASGDPRPSSGLYGYPHICGINTHVHINKNSKKTFKNIKLKPMVVCMHICMLLVWAEARGGSRTALCVSSYLLPCLRTGFLFSTLCARLSVPPASGDSLVSACRLDTEGLALQTHCWGVAF